jgi:hypothetical protein
MNWTCGNSLSSGSGAVCSGTNIAKSCISRFGEGYLYKPLQTVPLPLLGLADEVIE